MNRKEDRTKRRGLLVVLPSSISSGRAAACRSGVPSPVLMLCDGDQWRMRAKA